MNGKFAIGGALAGAALLGALAVAYSNAQPGKKAAPELESRAPVQAKFDSAEEEAIRAIVRDYIKKHPEVMVESLRAYSEQEQLNREAEAKNTAKAKLAALMNPAHGFVAGPDPAQASVVVVEMYDYHCGFCKRAAAMVTDVAKKDRQVKVVFRELPILREESDFAAEASLAARAQGKFLDLHVAMMNAQGTLTRDRIKEIATKQGLDFAALEKEAKSPAVKEAIEETHALAAEMAIDGTPTFVIAALDGSYVEVIPGFREDLLADAISDAKKAAKKK